MPLQAGPCVQRPPRFTNVLLTVRGVCCVMHGCAVGCAVQDRYLRLASGVIELWHQASELSAPRRASTEGNEEEEEEVPHRLPHASSAAPANNAL